MPKVTKQTQTGTPRANGMGKPKYRSAWDVGDWVKCLIYGQSNSGKTVLWSSFPKPILALICSGSKKPGELKSIDSPEFRETVEARIVDSVSQLKEMLADAGEFATVVLDHVSGLQDLTLKEILGMDELPAQKGFGLASQQQWGQSTAQCKEVLRAILGLDANVVIVGQERRSGDEGTPSEIMTPTVGVAVTPSLAGWLNPTVDSIFQTFKMPKYVTTVTKVGAKEVEQRKRVPGVEYCLRVGPHDVFVTKIRVPKHRTADLPEYLVDATYETIQALLKGE